LALVVEPASGIAHSDPISQIGRENLHEFVEFTAVDMMWVTIENFGY
jgi:hypothetical protein